MTIEEINISTMPASVSRRRYVIGVMLLLLITVGYIDRMNLSIAAPAIAHDFHLSDVTRGLVLSSFFWGYALMMLPGGWIVDRGGKHAILPIAIVGWTLASMATGISRGLYSLLGVRIALGVGEAPMYPSGNVIIREWSPLRERGVFTSLMQTGTLLGPGVASAPAAYLVTHFGWRPSFFILSSLGFLWLIAWLLVYRKPENAKWLGESERQHILATRDKPKDLEQEKNCVTMSIWSLVKQRPMIGILLANGPQTYSLYFLLTWLPSYLTDARKFDLMNSGFLTSAMFLLAMAGAILLGYISDRWLSLSHEQASRGLRRRVVTAVMVTELLAMASIPWIANRYLLVLAVAITLMMVTAAITLTYALTSDLIVDETCAGRTFAVVSCGGQVMGLLAPIVTGAIVSLAGYTYVFIATALLLLMGATSAWTLPKRQLQPLSN